MQLSKICRLSLKDVENIISAKQKRNIILALIVAIFLGAMEGTVVTTAMPTIVRELQGFQIMSWVFSVYLLTSAVTTPIYGKFADMYGRKKTLSIGITIFIIGSCLCGFSQNMLQLIFFRGIQGLGAGAIFTVTYTIVGDVFTLAERARVQGILSSVWGVASLLGPLVGGSFIDFLSWHWIFFINLPLGLLSLAMLQKNLTEDFEKQEHQIDYGGIIFLSIAIVAFLGIMVTWYTVIVFVLAMIIFYFIEQKAHEPVIPLEILTRNTVIVHTLSFLASAILMGADVYLPLFMQSVLGIKAIFSGLTMAPMSLSWLIAAFFMGKALIRYGERWVMFFSFGVLIGSCLMLLPLDTESNILRIGIAVFIMGIGFGGCFPSLTIIIQTAVGYEQRGAATALNSLVRTIGQTVGVSSFGSLLNVTMARYFAQDGSPSTGLVDVNALNFSLHAVFIAFVIIAMVCFLLSFSLSNQLKEEKEARGERQ